MSKNPFLNAFTATFYIVFIALFMIYGTKLSGPGDSIIAPIAAISLFTLSAAVMGYLFLYNPFMLFMDGKKKEAVNLFLKTVAVFGVITFVILILLFSNVFPKQN